MADKPGLVDPRSEPKTPPIDPEMESIDPRFKDKSVVDVAKSYSELEGLMKRQAQELGELRAAVQQTQAPKEPDEADFYDDPTKVVKQLIAKEVQPLRQHELEQRLATEHPDWRDIVENPEFSNWVNGSRIRRGLYEAARGQMDYEAADELLNTWRTQSGHDAAAVEQAVQKDRKRRAATTESGSPRQPKGKIYSRSWLRQLKTTNRAEYDTLAQGDLLAAYREGRVRD